VLASAYTPAATSPFEQWVGQYVAGRLDAGLRLTQFILLNDKSGDPYRGSFVGTLTRLREEQEYWPPEIWLEYEIVPTVGMGIAYDNFEVGLWDAEGKDGTADLHGPLLYAVKRFANESRCTPLAELGLAGYFVRFRERSGWDDLGVKQFVLEDSLGFFGALGCDIEFPPNWAVNLYGRWMVLEVDGAFYVQDYKDADVRLTLSHLACGVGVRYSF
jgi:hypothetical protein